MRGGNLTLNNLTLENGFTRDNFNGGGAIYTCRAGTSRSITAISAIIP